MRRQLCRSRKLAQLRHQIRLQRVADQQPPPAVLASTRFPTTASYTGISRGLPATSFAAVSRPGPAPDELVFSSTQAGTAITVGLDALARCTDLSIVACFAEGVVVAIERCSPLVDVPPLRPSTSAKHPARALIETGARNEWP
jgi:hypothetical protein